MGKKLFVSNLDFEITTEQLRELFEELGECVSVVIAVDRETKRSKGFGFVEMASGEAAQKAIETLNLKVINNRPIKVVEDRGRGGGSGADGESGDGQRKYEPLPAIQRTQIFRRRKRLDPFLDDPNAVIDYKDVAMLSKYVSERGRILSRRLTGLTAFNQRKVTKAIKRAQNMGIMSLSNNG